MGSASLRNKALIQSDFVDSERGELRRFKIREEVHKALGRNRVGAAEPGNGDVGQKFRSG